jgi:cholesterol oxidase
LRFTERMVGAFTYGEADYATGQKLGATQGIGLAFHLTINTDDVDAFIADPRHAAVAQGYVDCDALGGKLPVESGLFNLFVDEGTRHRRMLYRLYFSDATGRPLTLAGFKDVRPGPITAVWPETSTLYTRMLNGHVAVRDGGAASTGDVVGSGILRIRVPDFAWQLTTFRVDGPSWGRRLKALDDFGQLFLAELWHVFVPFRRLGRRG